MNRRCASKIRSTDGLSHRPRRATKPQNPRRSHMVALLPCVFRDVKFTGVQTTRSCANGFLQRHPCHLPAVRRGGIKPRFPDIFHWPRHIHILQHEQCGPQVSPAKPTTRVPNHVCRCSTSSLHLYTRISTFVKNPRYNVYGLIVPVCRFGCDISKSSGYRKKLDIKREARGLIQANP
jgi:hypothetical protein